MKKKRFLIVISVILLFAIFIFFIVNNFGKQQIASLEIKSNTNQPFLVDGKNVGSTSFNGTFPAKEVVVQIGNYETRVKLQPGIKTIINRNENSGEVVSFENIGGESATIAIVTNPSGARINIDGIQKGFSPMNVDLSSGTHRLDVQADGYLGTNFAVNLINGYKLIAVIDLAISPQATQIKQKQEETQKTETLDQLMVKILDTPNGFLRVRSDPATTSAEIGQVKTGETYPLISTDAKTGWYNIQLATISGWISNTYAATESATPN